jgi:hypothetical protein
MTAQKVKIIFNFTKEGIDLPFITIPRIGDKIGIEGTLYIVTHVWHVFDKSDPLPEIRLFLSEVL